MGAGSRFFSKQGSTAKSMAPSTVFAEGPASLSADVETRLLAIDKTHIIQYIGLSIKVYMRCPIRSHFESRESSYL